MNFAVHHHYDHPADRVFAALTDFDVVKAKYERLGHGDVTLVERREGDGGAVTLVTRRIVPLDVPAFAKRVLSPKNTVVQTDSWSAPDGRGVRTGTFSVVAKGVPVNVGGTLRLEPEGETACVNTIEAHVDCKIPLVGGKIADFVSADTRKAVDHEETWTTQHLASV